MSDWFDNPNADGEGRTLSFEMVEKMFEQLKRGRRVVGYLHSPATYRWVMTNPHLTDEERQAILALGEPIYEWIEEEKS